MEIILFIILVIVSYFFGAIPFGLVYSRIRGVDIRKVGSGNIGATNVSRQFGFLGGFVPVFMLDFCKSALPVLIVRIFGVKDLNPDIGMILVGFAAALGHIFPIYLKFKGGKGVATFAGFYFMTAPLESLICLAGFILVLMLFRLVSYIKNKEPKFFKNIQKD